MATKCRVTFYAYNDGREVDAVHQTTMVNSFDKAEQRMRAFVENRYDQAKDSTVLFNEKHPGVGVWTIGARSNIDTDMYFLFIINKL